MAKEEQIDWDPEEELEDLEAAKKKAFNLFKNPHIIEWLMEADAAGLNLEHNPEDPIEQALTRCRKAWGLMLVHAMKVKGISADKAQRAAAGQYSLAMPPLSDHSQARAYVACVAQGLQIRVFDAKTASGLLYAAQVTASMIQAEARAAVAAAQAQHSLPTVASQQKTIHMITAAAASAGVDLRQASPTSPASPAPASSSASGSRTRNDDRATRARRTRRRNAGKP